MERMADDAGYELLDVGGGRRLERFGTMVVDRPSATAEGPRRASWETWRNVDLRFDAGSWIAGGRPAAIEDIPPWTVEIEGLPLELRVTSFGGVGLYPEHAANLPWLEAQVAARAATGDRPSVLNLFAHTGLATLAAVRAGAAVTHVDAARAAVAWARENAARSGLAEAPVRWLVDDASGFVAREARRESRYDGFVLDPPSFGRAGRRPWKLAEALPGLLDGCAAIATEDAFVLLSAHTTGLDAAILKDMLRASFPSFGSRLEAVQLGLESLEGDRLDLGWAVRAAPSAG